MAHFQIQYEHKDYLNFLKILKKGKWRHNQNEADQKCGQNFTLLHWCALKKIDQLPEMLDAVRHKNVRTLEGYNAAMIATFNPDINLSIFNKLIEEGVLFFPTRSKNYGGKNMYLDSYNPLVNLLRILFFHTADGEIHLDEYQSMFDYLTDHISENWSKKTIIAESFVFLIKDVMHSPYFFHKEMPNKELFCLSWVEKWFELLLQECEQNSILYSLKDTFSKAILFVPDWLGDTLEKKSNSCLKYVDLILDECRFLLQDYLKDFHISNLSHKQEKTLQLVKRLFELDHNFDEHHFEQYFKNKEKMMLFFHENSDYFHFLAELNQKNLSEKLELACNPSQKNKKSRI